MKIRQPWSIVDTFYLDHTLIVLLFFYFTSKFPSPAIIGETKQTNSERVTTTKNPLLMVQVLETTSKYHQSCELLLIQKFTEIYVCDYVRGDFNTNNHIRIHEN